LKETLAVRDLTREVFGLFGIPVDKINAASTVKELERAAAAGQPFVWSTPNLNYLVLSQTDVEFRESLLLSDLCPVDGTPLVWLARLVGIPLTERVAGSDVFDLLKSPRPARPIKVCFFGGVDGLAERVARKINAQSVNTICVAAISPGFGNVAELSQPAFIEKINASGADFLLASLGSKKGQEWLVRNHHLLTVPIRAHLGATLNFQAGTVRRAPQVWRKVGMEWLWRIREEPYLWRRYFRDGLALLRIVMFQALPLIAYRLGVQKAALPFAVHAVKSAAALGSVTLKISGAATDRSVPVMVPILSELMLDGRDLTLDFHEVSDVDPRFFGLLMMIRKVLHQNDRNVKVINVTSHVRRLFRLNGVGYLLDVETVHNGK